MKVSLWMEIQKNPRHLVNICSFSFDMKSHNFFSEVSELMTFTPSMGGGGTPLYKLYSYMLPQRVWFLSRFGLK